MPRISSILLILSAALAFPACLADAEGPTVIITSPAPGEIMATSVEVEIEVENFILDPEAMEGANEPGHGHWHLYLDDDYLGAVGEPVQRIAGLAPGEHTIRIELVNNDHSPLEPPVFQQVGIDVSNNARSVDFVRPVADGDGIAHHTAGQPLDVEIALTNFSFVDPNANPEPAPCMCEGHWHLFLNGEYLSPPRLATTITVSGAELPAGEHVLEANLVQNDHSDLDPPVFAFLPVLVE